MDTVTLTIVVNAAPVAVPSISISTATVTATVGNAIADITITSNGGTVASYGIAPTLPEGLTLDTSNGTISGTPTAVAASTNYTITATNSSGLDTVTLTIVVNAAPVAVPSISISAATVTATVGTAIADISITSNGGAVASYGIAPTLPDGLTLDTSNGTISGTPTAVSTSTSYTITATNSSGTDTVTLTIVVNAAPVAVPSISISSATVTATVGTAIANISITSSGGAVASYGIAPTLPEGLTLDTATGTISGTPTAVAEAITHTITATNSSGEAMVMLTITVTAGDNNNPNVAPTISGTPDTTVAEGTAYNFTPIGADVDDGATLVYSIENKPGWATFSTTGALTGTPTNADVGTTSDIVITLTSGSDTVSLPAFNLTVTNVNDAPTITGMPATTVAEDTAYSFTPTGADADATLAYTIENKPSWATFSTTTGALTGTPTNADVGSTSGIVITLTSGSDTVSLPAFNLAVTNVNDAPTITGTPATTVAEGNAYSFAPTGVDADAGATLVYTITNKPSWATFSTTTGALTGTPTNADVGSTSGIVITLTSGSDTVSLPAFNLAVTATALTPESAKQLNEEILPRLIHTMLGGTVSAVNSRMDDTFSGTPQVASYQFDGQTVQLDSQTGLSANLQNTVAQKLPNYLKSLKDGTMDWREMLSRSAFVMPLNAAGGAGSTAGATVWGGGDYNRMSGKFSDGDWKGDVLSVQLGIDQRLGKDMLAGGLVSWSKGDVDYNLTTQNGKETRGDYTHQITSVHPYFARSNDEVDLWGSVGYGQGKLAIKQQSPTEDSERSSDTRLLSLSAGGSGRLSQSGLKLKSDIILAQVDIAASADKKIPADKLSSQRLRLLLEMGKERPLSSGGHFKPLLEVGLRYDGGVGESSGIGAVLNLGGHYANTTGLTVEGKLHTLLGQDDYQEWGIQGTIRQQANANGQGLSFSLNPSYGTVGISTNQVWQQELADDNNGTSTNSARLNVNMGYGLFTAGGLLTPYSEVSMSDSNHYRLGLRWKPSSPLSLHLYGERETSNNSDRILLEGRIRF